MTSGSPRGTEPTTGARARLVHNGIYADEDGKPGKRLDWPVVVPAQPLPATGESESRCSSRAAEHPAAAQCALHEGHDGKHRNERDDVVWDVPFKVTTGESETP